MWVYASVRISVRVYAHNTKSVPSVCVDLRPIVSTIVSMFAEENELKYAVPGGLIGVGTKIDPTLTRADRLVGQVLGHPGRLPDCFGEMEVSYYLLRRLLGVRSQVCVLCPHYFCRQLREAPHDKRTWGEI